MADDAAAENARVLEMLAEQGADLSLERRVDFTHLLADAESAQAFAERARVLGYDVAVHEPDEEDLEEGFTEWDVVCTTKMVPAADTITTAESSLAEIAEEYGGSPDGWGFYE